MDRCRSVAVGFETRGCGPIACESVKVWVKKELDGEILDFDSLNCLVLK